MISRSVSEISSTPARAGTFSFTARVADRTGMFPGTSETIAVSPA